MPWQRQMPWGRSDSNGMAEPVDRQGLALNVGILGRFWYRSGRERATFTGTYSEVSKARRLGHCRVRTWFSIKKALYRILVLMNGPFVQIQETNMVRFTPPILAESSSSA